MGPNDPGQPPPVTGAPTGAPEPTIDLPVPATALAIGAHPDDVEFGCGASLAKWAAHGCVVHHLVLTDGSKGTWDTDADVSALVIRRELEQIEAASRLRGEDGSVRMLGRRDGELRNDASTRRAIVRTIRELRPAVVLGHDPWKRYRLHPDHRNAGLLTCDAIVEAREPHSHRDSGLPPHRPRHLLLWEADVVNHAEDVSDWVDTKLLALEAHASQFESTMGARTEAELEQFRARIRSRLAEIGAPLGLGSAEAFARIDDL